MKKITLIALIQVLAFNMYFAKCEECIALLRDGKYNYLKQTSYYSSTEEATSVICSISESYKSDKSVANASAKLRGVFRGSGSYTREEVETIFKMYCDERYSFSDKLQSSDIESQFIDKNFLDIYLECVKACNDGLEFSIQPADPYDPYMKHVTFTLNFNGNIANAPTIKSVSFDKSKLKVISDEMLDAVREGKPISGAKTLVLERKDIKDTPFSVGGDSLYATAHSITFNFNSKTYTINFPEVKYKPKSQKKGGIQSGYTSMGAGSPEWSLDDSNPAERNVKIHVNFEEPFDELPKVTVSLSMIDASNNANLRIAVFPTNITTTGFDISISTWADSKISQVRASWIAVFME